MHLCCQQLVAGESFPWCGTGNQVVVFTPVILGNVEKCITPPTKVPPSSPQQGRGGAWSQWPDGFWAKAMWELVVWLGTQTPPRCKRPLPSLLLTQGQPDRLADGNNFPTLVVALIPIAATPPLGTDTGPPSHQDSIPGHILPWSCSTEQSEASWMNLAPHTV